MERIDISGGADNDAIALALKGIRDGYIVCAPAEHGYIFLVDAFSEFAVRAMHVLRGARNGTSAQVLIASAETLPGIARDLSEDVMALTEAFWPGLLSLNLRPNRGLAWDLGDGNTLDRFSVRSPQSIFLQSILAASGPLAVASASRAGEPPMRSLDSLLAGEFDLAAIFDAGTLKDGPLTTVIEADLEAMTIIRESAISVDELAAVVPALSPDKPIS
jgi:tRNA threonylcarbamoyl adenosine modification protein (Sua5/YciO/YrdC/YwlC family)